MSIPFAPWIAKDILGWAWNESADVFNTDQTPAPPVTMSLWGGDFWGYIPPGAKTTQSVWGQQNRPGYGIATMMGPLLKGDSTAGITIPGLPNDMLSSMIGNGPVNANSPTTQMWSTWGGNSMQPNTFAYINTQPNNAFLWDKTQCTPFNFPKCSMIPMKNSSIIAWTPNQMSLQGCQDDGSGNVSCPISGNGTIMFEEFMASLDDLWVHYKSNNTEYLSKINEHDTSNWDPCRDSGKEVDTVVQLTFGVLFAVGLRVVQFIFIPETAELIDLPGNVALTVGPVAAGWFFAKHSLNSDKTAAEKDLSYCASSLIYTVSFLGAGFLGEVTDSSVVAIAIGAGGGYMLDGVLNSSIVSFFKGATIVPGFLLKFLYWLLKKIVKGKCVLDYADALLCLSPENADSDIQFKQVHSRRWDAVSIAALLTDEALADMNVTGAHARESKQAEYIWKGLMYGVAIMTIGSSGANGANGNVFENGTANPLGEITPINYGGAAAASLWDQGFHHTAGYSPWGQVFQPMGLGSWEGSSYQTGGLANWFRNWGSTNFTAACNLYGCNNWDVIRKNTYGAHQSPMTAHISEMMTNMKEALKTSYSDTNYQLMLQIPGTPTGDGWKTPYTTGNFQQLGLSVPFKALDKTAGFDPLAYALSVIMQHGDPTLLSILETNPNAITAQSNLQRICENDNPNKNVPCVFPSPQRWYTFAGAFHRYMLMKAKFPTPLLMLDNMDDEPGELMKAWIVQAWNVSIPNAPQFTSKYQAFLASEPNKTRLATYLNNPQAPPFVPEYST